MRLIKNNKDKKKNKCDVRKSLPTRKENPLNVQK